MTEILTRDYTSLDFLTSDKEFRRLALAEKCRNSLAEFCKVFWSIVVPNTQLIWGWYADAICDHLQAIDSQDINKLVICLPPGFAKSTFVSVMWPTYSWINDPWISSLFGSYDEKLTYRDSIKSRDIIRSKRYQNLFRPDWQLRSDVSSKGYYANTAQGARKTYYVGSSHSTGWRGNYLVVDDPLSAKNRYNKLEKKQVTDNWDGVLSTRVNRSQKHCYVIIMQRLAEDDLAGYVIDKYGDDYVQLILPANYKASRKCVTYLKTGDQFFADPRTEEGELLAPEFFPQSKLDEAKKALGEVDYAAQYQHEPYPAGGDRFKSEYFQYWKWNGQNIITLLNRHGTERHIRIDLTPRFITVDPAASEKTQADYTVMGLWAQTTEYEIILLDRIKMQGNEHKVIQSLSYLYGEKRFGRVPPMWVGMESNGLGLPIAQNARQARLPVLDIPINKDKIVMSATAIVRLQSGQIYFPDPEVYPWMHEFIKELVSFPAGAHDDSVSMVSLAASSVFEQHSESPRSAVTISNSKPRMDASRVQTDLSKSGLFGGNGVYNNEHRR